MQVSYNGVIISYASITSWQETAEYDSSGMNLIANKIELTIEGSVFPQFTQDRNGLIVRIGAETTNVTLAGYDGDPYVVHGDPQNGGYVYYTPSETSTFAFRLNTCLRNLSIPRGDFIISSPVTNAVIFEAYGQRDKTTATKMGLSSVESMTDNMRLNADVSGGPKPKSVKVLQNCNEFARISYTIEITKIRCLGGETKQDPNWTAATDVEGNAINPTGALVVSHRCWTEEAMDANFYMTRTYSGKLRITSPLISVHYFRNMFYPPLEIGFRRESVRFSESENGLELSYTVTDKQVRCAAPFPATAFSGTCNYQISNAAEQTFSLNLTMVGRPDAPKEALRVLCMQAVQAKLKQVTETDGSGGLVQKLAISENLGDPPSVSVSATYMLVSSTSTSASKGRDSQKYLEQNMLPVAEIIGTPLEWEGVEIGDVYHRYRRKKSDRPNPYGYDSYFVFEDDREDEDGSETGANDYFSGYLKCLATAPCYIQSQLPNVADVSTLSAEIDAATQTTTVKSRSETFVEEKEQSASGIQKQAIDFPYSFYKSDITYYTDFSRIVLPKARYVAKSTSSGSTGEGSESGTSSETNAEEDYSTYTLAELKNAIRSYEESLTAAESIRDAEEQAGIEDQVAQQDAIIADLKKKIADLKRELDSRSSVRVVQVAQPIPKARVVIEAERFGRLPELPDPNEIITTTGDDPITFTCLKVETQMCEPKPAVNTNESVSYSLIGTYEYALSRPYKKGDEVWLLQNPTFGSNNYYPTKVVAGNKIPDVDALTTMYDGRQLSHETASEESSNSGSGNSGGAAGNGESGTENPATDENQPQNQSQEQQQTP